MTAHHTPIDALFPRVRDLERHLGDPLHASSRLSFERAAELDEQQAFPAEFCDSLEQWGLHHYYVPVAHGGALHSFERVTFLIRAVARRDLTTAIGHGKTFLGSVCVWVGGSLEQQLRLARIVLDDRGQVALGLTEREHGSDLLATDTRATELAGGGYRLDGEKWLINNATRCRAMTVLAAIPKKRRSRLSLFLVDKRGLSEGAYTCTARNPTLGIRGADISGIRFSGAVLGDDALIGAPGAGLSILLRSLYLTRACISGLAMGAADTGLRCALDFAVTRQLYGAPAWHIPHVRRTLAECFADVLCADCVAITCARALNLLPGHARMVSAFAKYFVPAATERILDRLSVILGARFFLRDGHWHGVFQRMFRDARLLGLFDGSSVVNLRAIGMMVASLPTLRQTADDGDSALDWRDVFSLGGDVPALDPDALRSSLPSPLPYMEDLPALAADIQELAPETIDPFVKARLLRLVADTRDRARQLEQRIEQVVSADGMSARSYELIEYSRAFCDVHAAVCCVRLWLRCRDRLDPASAGGGFAGGDWLALGLTRLMHPGDISTGREYSRVVERVASHMHGLYADHRLFSVAAIALAGAATAKDAEPASRPPESASPTCAPRS